jgi:hypothetical protein
MARKKRIAVEARVGMPVELAELIRFACEATETPVSIWLRVAGAERLHREGWPGRYRDYMTALNAAQAHRGP